MRCRYCFYADVAHNRAVPCCGVMERRTSETLIHRVFDYVQPPGEVIFAFQGGEPTLAGLDYFRHFTSYAREQSAGRFALRYAIQTNGLLLDGDWIQLFREYGFLVGISLDGEESLHNYGRPDASGAGTYARVRQAIRLLEKAGVDYNILSVVTRQAAKHPQRAYEFCRKNHWDYVQLIPCLDALDAARPSPYALTPRLYASYYKRFFDQWYDGLTRGDVFHVRQFDNLFLLARGFPAEQCGFAGRCTPQFVVEADGGVYPCDFYVLDRYRCGDVHTDSIEQISASDGMARFLEEEPPLPPRCKTCRAYPLCRGGCRRYRAFLASEPDYCPREDFFEAEMALF